MDSARSLRARSAAMTATELFCTAQPPLAVIPGRAEGANPESIITGRGYGFRVPSLRSGPGMTTEG